MKMKGHYKGIFALAAVSGLALCALLPEPPHGAGFTPMYRPPYSQAELLEAEKELATIVVVGEYRLDHIPAPNVRVREVNGRINDYCGRSVYRIGGCAVGRSIYLAADAGLTTYLHELAHVREVYIEGKPFADTRDHVGWRRSNQR